MSSNESTMTGAVSGVPAEAIEAQIVADVLDDHRPTRMPNGDIACNCDHTIYESPDWRRHVGEAFVKARDEEMAADAASLREGIAAEVLGPVLALADEWADADGEPATAADLAALTQANNLGRRLRSILSAPVQAAEEVGGDDTTPPIDVERIRAAIRLVQPDHLTPVGARIIEQALGGGSDE